MMRYTNWRPLPFYFQGKIQLAAFDGPFPKTLEKISYTSWVIANSVPNLIAMATGVSQKKMQLAAFHGPSTKTSLQAQ